MASEIEHFLLDVIYSRGIDGIRCECSTLHAIIGTLFPPLVIDKSCFRHIIDSCFHLSQRLLPFSVLVSFLIKLHAGHGVRSDKVLNYLTVDELLNRGFRENWQIIYQILNTFHIIKFESNSAILEIILLVRLVWRWWIYLSDISNIKCKYNLCIYNDIYVMRIHTKHSAVDYIFREIYKIINVKLPFNCA